MLSLFTFENRKRRDLSKLTWENIAQNTSCILWSVLSPLSRIYIYCMATKSCDVQLHSLFILLYTIFFLFHPKLRSFIARYILLVGIGRHCSCERTPLVYLLVFADRAKVVRAGVLLLTVKRESCYGCGRWYYPDMVRLHWCDANTPR